MANDFKPAPRAKTAFDHKKLKLSIPVPDTNKKKWSSLEMGLYANNPRITVWTNFPGDEGESKGYGKITANLDSPTFLMFLNLLHKCIDHPGEVKYHIENKNTEWRGGKPSDTPVVVSKLWVGKDKDGIIWISVVSADSDRPKIKFPLHGSEFHTLYKDNVQLSPAEVSCLFAEGYANLMQDMMIQMIGDNYVEPPPPAKPKDGGKSYGGGGRSGGYGGGSNDDDIPF